MAELVTRLSLDDSNFSSGISSAVGSLNKLDKQATLTSRGLDNFFKGKGVDEMKSQFIGVERVLNNLEKKMGSASTAMKQQLRGMGASAAELEMAYRRLSDAEKQSGAGQELRNHIDQLIMKAGELKDVTDDVNRQIKFFASDTSQLDAFAQGLTALSASAQVATGALSLFGVSEQKLAAIQKTIISLIAITNGLKTIQNALQKNSNLMTFISIAREKGLAVALGLRTAATKAASLAEEAETGAVKANTAAWAMNPIGAIVIALVALVAGIVAVTKAVNDNSEAVGENSKAIKDNNGVIDTNRVLKERLKTTEEDWRKGVENNVNSQLSKYAELQLKWQECNRDQKSREKFQKQYGDEVNRVAGKVKKLSEYEDFFVRDTDKVVDAILARAAAEAGAEQYAKAMVNKALRDKEKSVANGRAWLKATEGEKIDSNDDRRFSDVWAAKKSGLLTGDDYNLVNYQTGVYITLTSSGVKKMNKLWYDNAAAIRAADDAELAYWRNFSKNATKVANEKAIAAGMGTSYDAPKAFSGGGGKPGGSHGSHGGSHSGSSGSGTGKPGSNPPEEIKPLAFSLEWLRQKLQKLKKDLSYGLIPEDKIEQTKQDIKGLEKDIEEKEIELGFKTEPIEGSLEWLDKEISKRQEDLRKGLIPEEGIDKTNQEIEDLTKRRRELSIKLKFEEPPETDYEKSEKQRKEFLKGYKDYLHNITRYAKDDDQYKKRLEEIKAYNEERDKAEKNWAENIPEVSEDSKKRAEETARAFNQLADDLKNGKITAEQYDEALAKLDNTLDEVTVSAPKPLKKPITFDLGNIPQQYQDVIAEIDKMLSQDDLEIEERIRLNETKASLEKKVNDITHGELSIPAKIVPEYVVKGSDEDLRQSYQNALQEAQQLQNDYEIGLINYDKAKSDLDKINEMLEELHLKPITLEIKSELFKQLDYAADTLNNFGSAISQLGNVAQDKALNAAGVIAEAIANIWLGYSKATLQAASMGPWAWVGFSVGALAQVIGVIASLKSNSFAGGGLVPGSSWSGDKVYARVNSGEMILNKKQQSNLFRMLDGGHSAAASGNVEFKLKGQELVGVIKNYNDKKSKLR